MPEPPPWLHAELGSLQEQGLIRRRRSITPLADARCVVNGKTLRNFASNDYLNLAQDSRVIEAARAALEAAGSGARASALICGRTDWHARLEERLARFEGQDAAVLFPTGYAANVGTISALMGPEDTVFCDRWNHASLVDGCRLAGARFRVYRHDDLSKLERQLDRDRSSQRRWIVTDGLFSMDGDCAPLPELCDLAERFGAYLLIDEAHGTGVFGERGRGVAEWLGVEQRISVRVGTLSKAVGALGGFVTGSQALADWLWNRARTQMFSTALPPAVCAAAYAAIDVIEAEPERRRHLLELAAVLRRELRAAGFQIPAGCTGPIIPVILRDEERTLQVAADLEARGFLVGAIRPPTVPANTSRLRITVTAGHSLKDVMDLAGALREAASADPCVKVSASQ